jgi:hypothetical protein
MKLATKSSRRREVNSINVKSSGKVGSACPRSQRRTAKRL